MSFNTPPLAEGMRDDLGAPALFPEQPFEHVGGARRPPVRNTGLEVIAETGSGARILALVARHELFLDDLRELGAAGPVGTSAAPLTSRQASAGTFASRLRILCARQDNVSSEPTAG